MWGGKGVGWVGWWGVARVNGKGGDPAVYGSEGVSCRAWRGRRRSDVGEHTARARCSGSLPTCGLCRVYVCPVYFSLLLLTRDTGAPLSHVKWCRLFSFYLEHLTSPCADFYHKLSPQRSADTARRVANDDSRAQARSVRPPTAPLLREARAVTHRRGRRAGRVRHPTRHRPLRLAERSAAAA